MKSPHGFHLTLSISPKGSAVAYQVFRAGKLVHQTGKGFVDPSSAWDHLIALATKERDDLAEFLRKQNARN